MQEGTKPRSRKKRKLGAKVWLIAGVSVVALAGIGAGAYASIGHQYEKVFFPNTTINGIDASKKTVEQVKEMIAAGIDGYTLTIEERNGISEQITKEDIMLQSVFDGSLEELLKAQEPGDWWKLRKESSNYEIKTMIQYDQQALDKKIRELKCLDEAAMIKPQDAHLSEYVSGSGYSVVPEIEGSEVKKEDVAKAVSDAILNLNEKISLEELNCYTAPAVRSDDPALTAQAEALNRYVKTTVTYQFGDKTETLGADQIASWLSIGADNQISVNQEAVAAYVAELASKYDTYKNAKNLKTSYGGATVRITGGIYGWRINQGAETEELMKILASGESQTREPIYRQKAASRGVNDYGDTYVEINLTAQHLFFYKNGKLVVESDFVSGNRAKGYDTPAGTYSLTYKEKNAVLKGENYRTPVDYWMPFNGGIGLHDATWRSSFGGTIYKTSGSHGCVNLPHAVAKTIFENISAGIPVLCYHLEGTEAKTTTTSAGKKVQETTAPTTAPAVVPESTEAVSPSEAPTPTETSAPETAPAPQPSTETSAGEVGPGVSGDGAGEPEIGPGV